ncbi:unnamed protein product [Kuraishia capsulata CBS 1993]|uniref:Zn(2)-C6 fungal-type domain-containing protein n=1 Tax=Kuraishia capsulata CBS 1993 TaxID=1382522 RepID=W6MSF5_9ASCO|nr:uncharacterized protein KUCA_T00004123001 [Kuraishia capsulata CBS 1993]CDK28142.1 unnamed protein product [Kuraishia capsulata CBS 1993]
MVDRANASTTTMKVYPISCVECRRRKIKCNKVGPVCNQCIKRDTSCEYPGKFRSIEVETLLEDKPKVVGRPGIDRNASYRSQSGSSESNNEKKAASPGGTVQVKFEEETAPSEVEEDQLEAIQRENEVLKLKLKELRLKLRQHGTDKASEENGLLKPPFRSGDFSDNEDTANAKRGRYYGPNSTEYMISQTSTKTENGTNDSDYDNFMKMRRQISQKRDLPILIDVPLESLSKIKVRRQLATSPKNIELIIKLVKRFFMFKTHNINFVSEKPLIDFLNNYTRMKEWSHDDEMLLVLAILITVLRSLEPDNALLVENNLSYAKMRGTLYKQFKNLRNGVSIDTVTNLQAYVIECEDLFYNDQPEKSWTLLFRIVSSAYSLGLHVFDKNIVKTLKNEVGEKSLEVIRKHPRTSLWLTINFLSAVLCSILGRPNPVTFTFQPLLRNCEIRLNYKIGISELIKKSTQVLIESYKVEIDYSTILEIDEEFENEIIIYEKILSDRRAARLEPGSNTFKASLIRIPLRITKDRKTKRRRSASVTALNELPSDLTFTIQKRYEGKMEKYSLLETDCETICDLILVYGNRAKFHQHFMSQHKSSAKSCLDSVIKVLDHFLALVEILKDKMDTTDFQSIYPFFYCFAYQSFVVIYTFLMMGLPLVYDFFDEIKLIRSKLQNLFEKVGEELWRPSTIRIVRYINEMCDNLIKIHEEEAKGPSRVPSMASMSNTGLYKSNSGLLLKSPSARNMALLRKSDSSLSFLGSRAPAVFQEDNSSPRNPLYSPNGFFGDGEEPNVQPPGPARFSIGSDCGDFALEDSPFGIDPLLGFNLDDPFFVQNPINFNVARPGPPIRTNTSEYANYFDGDGNINEFGGRANTDYLFNLGNHISSDDV